MKTQHRLVGNDPEYERITAIRRARSHRFTAKVLGIIGLLGIPVYGIGMFILVVAFFFWLNAKGLEVKFKE